ncbi:hypothetical protein D3C75_743080 [compost metagenome]
MVVATQPIDMVMYCTVTRTSGTRLNGISIIGFMMTGRPNSTGSLMLKMEEPAARRETFLMCWLRANNSIAITRDKVAPAPPIQIMS